MAGAVCIFGLSDLMKCNITGYDSHTIHMKSTVTDLFFIANYNTHQIDILNTETMSSIHELISYILHPKALITSTGASSMMLANWIVYKTNRRLT